MIYSKETNADPVLYRALSVLTNEIVTGFYFEKTDNTGGKIAFIYKQGEYIEVIKESVGYQTGLIGVDQQPIYSNSILYAKNFNKKVFIRKEGAAFQYRVIGFADWHLLDNYHIHAGQLIVLKTKGHYDFLQKQFEDNKVKE